MRKITSMTDNEISAMIERANYLEGWAEHFSKRSNPNWLAAREGVEAARKEAAELREIIHQAI